VAHISVGEAQAWAESSKLPVTVIDEALDDAVSATVLARLAQTFDVSAWVSSSATPSLVRKIIAMQYISQLISRAYASDEVASDYSIRLLGMSEGLIDGLTSGTTVLTDIPSGGVIGSDDTPSFYPDDASGLSWAQPEDRSLGGPAFTMGVIW
jgi:hypothetical protein